METLAAGLSHWGWAALAEDIHSSTRIHHLRFLREARCATPISGFVGIVDASTDGLIVEPDELDEGTWFLTELRHSLDQSLLCACLHFLAVDGVSGPSQAGLNQENRPRGVSEADSKYASYEVDALTSLGFECISTGVFSASESVPSNKGAWSVALPTCMGRISDGMPHLWAKLKGDDQLDGQASGEGGAVLEYRLRYHAGMHKGMAFTLHSGLSEVGEKVQQFEHLMHNVVSGDLIVSAKAAAVRMDLEARRAIRLDSNRQEQMRTHLVGTESDQS